RGPRTARLRSGRRNLPRIPRQPRSRHSGVARNRPGTRPPHPPTQRPPRLRLVRLHLASCPPTAPGSPPLNGTLLRSLPVQGVDFLASDVAQDQRRAVRG